MDIMDSPSPFAQTQNKVPKEFEKLHHMEKFSEAMFNRIIAFQEKQHPAWNPELPFSERIQELPLHALVFSNPDRDPAVCGPTVAPFYPQRGEMQQIAHIARQVAQNPVVCDVHASNGFVGSLLAREGIEVSGWRDPALKPNQIAEFFDADCYRWQQGAFEDIRCDMALSVWMPSGLNRTPQIVALRPKLIVFIHTDHVDESSGKMQTGTAEAFNNLADSYRRIAGWSITRPKDLFHEVWPDLTPSIEEIRHVSIYADEPWHDIDIGEGLEPATPYDWELELDMALTAYQAKMHLRDQGYPV